MNYTIFLTEPIIYSKNSLFVRSFALFLQKNDFSLLNSNSSPRLKQPLFKLDQDSELKSYVLNFMTGFLLRWSLYG